MKRDVMDLFTQSSAVISACQQYRYRLGRRWGDGPTCGFIMLNPSTANAYVDDPTIGRCIGFAKREKCGGLEVANIFAFRATDPDEMIRSPHPMGPEWREHFDDFLAAVDGPLIAGWGSQKGIDAQVATVRQILREASRMAFLLVRNKDGSPRHPLYVKGDAPLMVMA